MESYILYAACQAWGFYVNSRFSEDEKKSDLLFIIFLLEGSLDMKGNWRELQQQILRVIDVSNQS